MRLLFVADVHGADVILRKALHAVAEYRADALIVAGDLCGKVLVPLIKDGPDRFIVTRGSRSESIPAAEADEVEAELAGKGVYSFRASRSEVDAIRANPLRQEAAFTAAIVERMERWMTTIASELDLSEVWVMITPGNDDPFEVDEVLLRHQSSGIHSHLEGIAKLGSHEVATLDYTNPTPWHTPREQPEGALAAMIDERLRALEAPARSIFNFHCPPYGSRLDRAPRLTEDLKQVSTLGDDGMIHVGSVAVREAIARWSPLLSLHGHIHESAGEDRIGTTVCLNPGSEYANGILHGYVVDLSPEGELAAFTRFEG